jgi:hypothetical protein
VITALGKHTESSTSQSKSDSNIHSRFARFLVRNGGGKKYQEVGIREWFGMPCLSKTERPAYNCLVVHYVNISDQVPSQGT